MFAFSEGGTNSWSVAADIATTLAGFLALLAAPIAIWNYRKSVQTRRAEWLSSLHEKFFETTRYSEVRRILDYKPEPEYSELQQAVRGEVHLPITDEFYRYLNFFELLASLKKLKEITDDEVTALFQYDLELIAGHEFIVHGLKSQGFERLPELLKSRQTS